MSSTWLPHLIGVEEDRVSGMSDEELEAYCLEGRQASNQIRQALLNSKY